MDENLLAVIFERLARDRDSCDIQRVETIRHLEAAKTRNEELQQELKACEVDKLAAQKAACDAHARARATKEALALVDQQCAVASAVLSHKEAQLLQYSECSQWLHQHTQELERQQKRRLEDALQEASSLRCEVDRLRKDLEQQETLRKRLEQARQETSSLQSSLENARANASAALSERDNLKRQFEELRRRFVNVESEASTFRNQASAAKAGSNAATVQLEDLRRELKETEQSKNVCFAELHLLRKQVDDAKNEAAIARNQANGLQRELHAICKESKLDINTNPKSCVEEAHRIITASAPSEFQKKLVEASAPIEAESSIPTDFIKTSNPSFYKGACVAKALHKDSHYAQCVKNDKALLSDRRLEEQRSMPQNASALSERQLPSPSALAPAASPHALAPPSLLSGLPPPPPSVQYQKTSRAAAHCQSEHLRKQNTSSCFVRHPLHLQRTKSRLWRTSCTSSIATKKQKRGPIFKSDLEKVGYTPGCKGCLAVNKEHPQSHTDACRARVFKEMVRLNLPGARRLKDAEKGPGGQDHQRSRILSCPTQDEKGVEIHQGAVCSRSIMAIVRASAIK